MTQNPFGEGGLDMNALLQQAQQMQSQIQSAQAELTEATVDGSAGGGAVTVTVNGVGELVGVRFQPGSVSDDEDLADLGDLVVAAYRDAKVNADKMAEDKLGPMTQGLGGMPGLA